MNKFQYLELGNEAIQSTFRRQCFIVTITGIPTDWPPVIKTLYTNANVFTRQKGNKSLYYQTLAIIHSDWYYITR